MAALCASEARASGARGAAPPPPAAIFGGDEAEICAFPGVVSLDDGERRCTGALVHPRVVLYAAHCGAAGIKVGFGQSAGAPDHVVEPDLCVVNPDYAGLGDEANDWAFCRLPEPAPAPVLPIAFGCETALLEPMAEAVIVGFGEATSGAGDGPKRWGAAPVRLVLDAYFEVGGLGEPGVCAGDSGGPALIAAADGTWRVFGVASVHAAGCGGIGHYARAWDAIAWIEAEAGVELTPCHAPDGAWDPEFRCSGFAPAVSDGVGDWSAFCSAAVGPAGTSCGPAFDVEPDATPPSVAISSPAPGPAVGPALAVTVDADDIGWGVVAVALEIDGEPHATDDEPPFAFAAVELADGDHTLVAVAEDAAGLVTRSAPVVIEVAAEAPDTGPHQDDDAGCGCAAGSPGGLAWMLFGTWWLGHARRRRRGPAPARRSAGLRDM